MDAVMNGHRAAVDVNGLFAEYSRMLDAARELESQAIALAAELRAKGIDLSAYAAMAKGLDIANAADLMADNPSQREVLIDGLLRAGETMNVIASPKMGKSWLVLGLAVAVSNGQEWLGHRTRQSRVLIIDNELHRETLSFRLKRVSDEMGLPADQIDILSLRGQSMDIAMLNEMTKAGKGIPIKRYGLVILDALYRMFPAKTNENENGAMTAIYNAADSIASVTKASVVIVHHSSKGDQSQKGVTDVGSGAGAIARAADTHLAIRPHALESSAVLEAVTRSFVSPQAETIVFNFPLWRASHIEPELKQVKNKAQVDQEGRDAETDRAILEAIGQSSGRLTSSQIRTRAGFGADRVNRGLARLVKSGELIEKRVKNRDSNRKKIVYEVLKSAV